MERRSLWRLPADLMAMGWQLVSAREVPRSPAPTWYTVLYARPFERGIDDEALATHSRGDWWIEVVSTPRRCLSWDDAHREAVERIRDADHRRRSSD